MRRFSTIICTLLLSVALYAGVPGTATQRKAVALDATGGKFECCNWGILAVNAKGDTIANLNSKRRMVPASNMKLITTGAALITFGGGYTFKTEIATDGEVRDTTLHGNLYIIGGGDPLIGNLFSYLPKPDIPFGKWYRILEDKGIRRIEGSIIGNGSYFDDSFHTDWSNEDRRSKDGVVPSGLTWRGKMEDPLPDGPIAAAEYFKEWLQAKGVTVSEDPFAAGEPAAYDTPADSLTMLGTAASASLRTIVSIANHQSDNFCAETLIKAIGKKIAGSDDYDHATAALHRALSPLGLAVASHKMRFADGSGLSRKNYISPDFIVRFLCAMQKTKSYSDFHNSLPMPGRSDGTLKTRLPKAPAEIKNRIWMKSGSMAGTRCFSGYIDSSDGTAANAIAFSVMVNNYVGSSEELSRILDELILSLANEN